MNFEVNDLINNDSVDNFEKCVRIIGEFRPLFDNLHETQRKCQFLMNIYIHLFITFNPMLDSIQLRTRDSSDLSA